MNNTLSGLLAVRLVSSATLAGCAPNHVVVLVPDPDGHVGKAEVTTAAGKQLLEKPADMTRCFRSVDPAISRHDGRPRYIAATFGEALAVEPLPAEKFILFFETGSTALVA